MAGTLLRPVLTIAALFVYEANSAAHTITATDGSASWKITQYATLAVKTGDTLIFNYNTNHDVIKMSDSTCGTTGNTELANKDHGGGSGILPNKYTYTVTSADETAGTIYFSCSYQPMGSYNHCTANQKITVTVTAASGAGAASGATSGGAGITTTTAVGSGTTKANGTLIATSGGAAAATGGTSGSATSSQVSSGAVAVAMSFGTILAMALAARQY